MSFHISPTPDLRPDTSSSSQSFPAVDDLASFFDMPDTPPSHSHSHSHSHILTSPDDLFSAAASLNWTTTLETMPAAGSDDSSPTDFAFEPPAMSEPAYPTSKTPTFGTASSYSAYPTYAPYGSFSASSFSSAASGSAGGSSFSSADALPAISRDFSRPSPTETRRPATAGGALQRSDYGTFQRLDIEEDKPEPIEENAESMFSNPFGSPKDDRQLPAQDGVDPRFLPQSRRASEGGFNMQPPSWPGNQYQMQSSAPPNVTQFNVLQQMHMQRPNSVTARPQTSDGLPTYHGVGTHVSLPSARTIVNQIDSQGSYYSPGLAPPAQIRSYDDKTVPTSSLMPFRDSTMPDAPPTGRYSLDAQKPLVRPSYMPAKAETKANGELTFVPLGGPAPRKRPRRRFDEIERLYTCGWNGCEKAYGTLNHLNAHVAMQKHGEKRLPAEFKDMRKAWRKKKREAAAAAANAQYMGSGGWNRASLASSSSESDYDRRDSTASMMSASSEYPGSAYSWDSRPSTSSSVASSIDARNYSQPYATGMANYGVPVVARRGSAPQHIVMPQQPQQGFRIGEGDHPTPTPQNPFPGQPRQQAFPFQTLTQPMPLQAGAHQGYEGQFAFQR